MTSDEILAHFDKVKTLADGSWMVTCPGHADSTASLHITEAEDRYLFKCQAGCETETLVGIVGLAMKDLFKGEPPKKEIVATYDYTDENGKVLHQSVRYWPKGFSQRQPDGNGGWIWNLKGVRTVLYNLPKIIANPESVVLTVEGEKDVHSLEKLGFIGTTNAGGAGKWLDRYSKFLRNRDVVILPDNDDPGREHASRVQKSITSSVRTACILQLPNLPVKGDVSDWIKAGGTTAQLSALIQQAQNGHTISFLDTSKEPPPLEWLVDDWVAKGDVILFGGRAGCGKSTTAMDLAIAVATGRNGHGWLGNHVKQGPVFYLDEETGEAEILRQLKRQGGSGIPNLYVSSMQRLWLKDPAIVERIENSVKDKRPALIVMDTVSHFFMGADENSAAEVTELFLPIFRLRDTYDVAIVLIHHIKKPGQNGVQDILDAIRGSTAFSTQPTAVWGASPSLDGTYIDLKMGKRRGGKKQSIRVIYEERDGLVQLSSIGEPDRVESDLDRISKILKTAMLERGPESRWTYQEMLEICEQKHLGERNAKMAISHLTGLGVFLKPKRGIYMINIGVGSSVQSGLEF